jgi:hypothetical protein
LSARRVLRPIDFERPGAPRWTALLWLALVSAGCGRAAVPAGPVTGSVQTPTTASTPAAPGAPVSGEQALCSPAAAGRLQAKLQGAIDDEINWSAADHAQCLGGPRPGGDGIRLLYKGAAAGAPLLVVIGVGRITRGASGRNLPANMTLIREGTGVFYATQGDDKCALDSLQQEPLEGSNTRFRLTGRGYCTQPARGVGTDGAVLVSRFDVEALVDFPVVHTE